MRILTTILLFFIALNVNARGWYFNAAAGNDNTGNGTIGAPYQTLNKLNSIYSTFANGDIIYFNRGDVFQGRIVIAVNGTTLDSYGSGAKAVISGFETISSPASVATNIYEFTPSIPVKSNLNILTINNNPQAVGRTNWIQYQSCTPTTITSTSFTGSYVGMEIVIKLNSYTVYKALITAQSGTTLTYSTAYATGKGIDQGSLSASTNGTPNYGCFFQRFLSSLDQQGEWYLNQSNGKIDLYSTVNPVGFTTKVSYVDTIINVNNRQNTLIQNLQVEGGGLYGVYSAIGNTVAINAVDFNNNTRAVHGWNTFNMTVNGCTMNNSFCNAIMIRNAQSKQITITNNVVTNSGQLIGMGAFWSPFNLKGVVAITDSTTLNNYVTIVKNKVINTGHAGIEFQGSNVLIQYNLIDTAVNVLDDNGLIYTFNNNTDHSKIIFRNRRILNNFMFNAIGAPLGANGGIDVAIRYNDDQTWNTFDSANTAAHAKGIGFQYNTPTNDTAINNWIYDCDVAIAVGKYTHNNDVQPVLFNNYIHKNTIYQKTATQVNFSHANNNLSLPAPGITITQSLIQMANIDSNYITNQMAAGYSYFYSPTGTSNVFPPNLTLSQWQNTYGHDVNSVLPPTTVTPTNTILVPNPTDTVLFYPFYGSIYQEPNGKIDSNFVQVPRWESRILIFKGMISNIPPTANAGSDQTITLPTSSTNISGIGSSDPDGTIASYLWSKISGPTGGTITNPNISATSVTALQQGVYVYKLIVTDNLGATGTDFMQITVNAANVPPTADAGADSTITLPQTTCTLIGNESDVDGTISSYLWTKISGPTGGAITNPTFATTGITGLQQGTYVYKFTVTDNMGATGTDFVQVVVNPAVIPPNTPPVANAGADSVITLPVSTCHILGSGSSDPDGTIVAYLWTKISGTGGAITSNTSANTTVTGLSAGTYIYQLRVTDNSGDTATDAVQVTVNAANIPPVANAGPDQTINLPKSTTTLSGSGTDIDGNITAFLWTKISGPTGGAITSSTSAVTGITGLVAGVYIYQLRVTDNVGDTASDAIQITVLAALPNTPPTPNAGQDQVIQLPLFVTTLTGTGTPTTTGATISSYAWADVAGNPTTGTIQNPSSAITQVIPLIAGIYQYQLTVTDSNGLSATDIVQITVLPAAAPNYRALLKWH